MLVRIQYALFVLLFMLLGAVQPARQESRGAVCASLSEESFLYQGDALRGCFAASPVSAVTAEVLDQVPGQKDLARPASDLRFSSAAAIPVAGSFSLPQGGFCPRPKEYYVYSLGRILI